MISVRLAIVGTTANIPGLKKAVAIEISTRPTQTSQILIPISIGISATKQARSISERIKIRLRSNQSMSTPAHRLTSRFPTNVEAMARDTADAEWVNE